MTTLWTGERSAAHGGSASRRYVELKETHSAAVFLVGDRAYKLKKPVDLGFLDFSTRARRRAACGRELALNRRLAPDVYLGIADVRDIDDTVLDHLLVMRRMPAERRLSYLVSTGAELAGQLRDLAAVLASFHRSCPRGADIARYGRRDAVRQRWRANFREIRAFVGTRIDPVKFAQVRALAEGYLRGREALFVDRINKDAVLDGHGDLLAEDIFLLSDGPRILDCIEFDDTLRYLDRVDDVACLVMDLERLGAAALAKEFLASYLEASGDVVPESLVHHYTAYRAFMRAKVACLPGAAVHDVRAPSTLLDLALCHLNEARVHLVVLGGAPGTGKTTTAEAIGGRLGWAVLSSDHLRKDLAGIGAHASAIEPYGRGIYSTAWTERTYDELLARAQAKVSMGESVVLDATWADERHRGAARDLAARTASDLAELQCSAPSCVVDERVELRRNVSDADPAIAEAVRRRFHPWPESVVVSTEDSPDAVVSAILSRLLPWRAVPAVSAPRMAAD